MRYPLIVVGMQYIGTYDAWVDMAMTAISFLIVYGTLGAMAVEALGVASSPEHIMRMRLAVHHCETCS